MSSDPRFTEMMRELAEDAPPAEGPAQARARRARTVAHLRGLQARAAVRREMSTSWRNRLLVAAALLVPSGALAAGLLPWSPFVRAAHVEPSRAPAASSAAPPARQSSKRARTAPATVVTEATPSEAPPVLPPPTGAATTARSMLAPPAEATANAPSRLSNVVRDPSTLADENGLMQAALAARREGQNARAVQLLTELLTRHPGSPLAQNAEVERFRALLRSGDEQSAARQASAYLGHYPNGMAADEARNLTGRASEPINERSF